LFYFGGTYLDLDISLYRRHDVLLIFPAFACLTTSTGISNDVLGSVPKHPFSLHVITSLERYHKNWVFPYITIMSSTGPLFLSMLWKEWLDAGRSEENGTVRVLVPDTTGGYGFFLTLKGEAGRDGMRKLSR